MAFLTSLILMCVACTARADRGEEAALVTISGSVSAESDDVVVMTAHLQGVAQPQIHTACWRASHEQLGTISDCVPVDAAGYASTDVYVSSNGAYIVDVAVHRGHSSDGPVVATSTQETWTKRTDPACAAVLADRRGLQVDNYYQAAMGGDADEGMKKTQLYVYEAFSPLCYGITFGGRGESNEPVHEAYSMGDYMTIASAGRGFWGVDYTTQEFGHGDRVFLDFILSRHRDDVRDIVEFGSGGGITSLYLGMAAAIRGGTLETFDVVDARSDGARRAWLPNMIQHVGDASVPTQTTRAAVRRADLVLVDHANRLNFTRDAVVPHLKQRGIVLVHDFILSTNVPEVQRRGPGHESHREWLEALGPRGFDLVYVDVAQSFRAELAVFLRRDEFPEMSMRGFGCSFAGYGCSG